MPERTLPVAINPLDLVPLDSGDVSLEKLLAVVCPPGMPRTLEDLRQRHAEITLIQPMFYGLPAEARMLNQLVWPLRQAKASYVTGNYLATIALCGLVAEMAARLVFEGHQLERGPNSSITDQQQDDIFGQKFEDLGQNRRVRVLRGLKVIDDELFQKFSRVRGVRNRHLHLSRDIDSAELSRDARDIYKDAVAIVAGVLGQGFKDGVLSMNTWVWRYLKANGFIGEPATPQSPDDATPRSGTEAGGSK